MKLRIAQENKKMDLRLRDKSVADNKVTQKEVDEFLKNLPDDAANMEEITIEPDLKKN